MAGTYLYFRCPCPINEGAAGNNCTNGVCRYAEIAPSAGPSFAHPPAFPHFSQERKLLSCQTTSSPQLKSPSTAYSFTEKTFAERLPTVSGEDFKWIPYRNEDRSSTERLKQTAKDVAQKNAESKIANPSAPSPKTGSQARSRRVRTAFTPFQLLCLETSFEKNHYVVGSERKQLASYLKLSETQVKVWFQNRRTKWKRQALENRPDLHKDPLTP